MLMEIIFRLRTTVSLIGKEALLVSNGWNSQATSHCGKQYYTLSWPMQVKWRKTQLGAIRSKIAIFESYGTRGRRLQLACNYHRCQLGPKGLFSCWCFVLEAQTTYESRGFGHTVLLAVAFHSKEEAVVCLSDPALIGDWYNPIGHTGQTVHNFMPMFQFHLMF